VNLSLKLSLAATLALAAASPALAAGEKSTATLYGGYYAADNGYEDRMVIGSFVDLYQGANGFHLDSAYVNREQNAAFGAVGYSRQLGDKVRAKVMVGTSTDNDNILPELFLSGSLQFKPANGLIVIPSVTHRQYRTGGKETAPAVQVAKYFNISGDKGGYYVAQADGGLSFNSSEDTGWSLGAGLTSVRKSGLTFGASARVGYMSYDSVLGTGVRSDIYGVSASIGHRVGKGAEVYLRGDVSKTDFFTVSGAMIGLKFAL
jgi:hypothetical protein